MLQTIYKGKSTLFNIDKRLTLKIKEPYDSIPDHIWFIIPNTILEVSGSQGMVVIFGETYQRCMSLCLEHMDIHNLSSFLFYYLERNRLKRGA